MKTLFHVDPWLITETELHREDRAAADAATAAGNGFLGADGGFEEKYSGDGSRRARLTGVWVPRAREDGERRGCSAFYGCAPCAPDILETNVRVGGEEIDLGAMEPVSFRRELDMRRGVLSRAFAVRLEGGEAACETERFFSAARPELLALRYRVTPSFDTVIEFAPAVDANVERCWQPLGAGEQDGRSYILARTEENPFGVARFTVCCAFSCGGGEHVAAPGRAERRVCRAVRAGETAEIVKFVAVTLARGDEETPEALRGRALDALCAAESAGFDALLEEHAAVWGARWDAANAEIEADAAATQGVRLALFRLQSGCMGEARNWEDDLFRVPATFGVQGEEAGKALLRERFEQLPQAMEAARAIGCKGALYPLETFDGEEGCRDGEAVLTALHRNAAVFYAFWFGYKYTGNKKFLIQYGMPVMLEICRFWVSRASWQPKRRRVLFLYTTGPNEYERCVANNWYTNRMARFCLETFCDLAQNVTGTIVLRPLGLTGRELLLFTRVARNLYLPESRGLFEQQDGFFDRDLRPAAELEEAELPPERHWSWDRLMRSALIAHADVLLGFYCLPHQYKDEEIAPNFDIYEPLTLHHGASAGVHAALAVRLGREEKAAELFGRAAGQAAGGEALRAAEQCGAWLALVRGYAGLSVESGALTFAPRALKKARPFSLRVRYQDRVVGFTLREGEFALELLAGSPLLVMAYDECVLLRKGKPVVREVFNFS